MNTLLFLLAQAEPVRTTSRDIVEVLQILILPIIIVSIPAILDRSKKAEVSSKQTSEASRNDTKTIVGMMETLLMNFGELRGDFKDLNEGQKDIKDSLNDHIVKDEAYMEMADKRMEHIEESLTA